MAAVAYRTHTGYLRALLSVVLTVGTLYWAKAVLVPIALAILLAFTLNPVVVALQRRGLNRVVGVVVALLLALACCVALGYVVGRQVRQLAADIPKNNAAITTKIAGLSRIGDRLTDFLATFRNDPAVEAEGDGAKTVVVRAAEPSSGEKLLRAASPVLEPLATAGFVIILVAYMLARREDLRNRLIGLMGHGQMAGTTRMLVDAADRVSKYLFNQLLINLGFGLIFAAGLALIGVPYAILWGALTVVLRFVPYIGSWVSCAFPFALSFAISPADSLQPLWVLVYFACIDLVVGNVVEPLVFGHSTGVSPVALLVAAAFWTWIWGPMGLLLSTPLTVCMVVLGQHLPQLSFLTTLLGDRPALSPAQTLYQRLLARDVSEAKEIAQRFCTEHGLARTFDELMIPALRQVRRDRRAGDLTSEDETLIFEAGNSLIAPLCQEGAGGDVASAQDAAKLDGRLILAIPSHHPSEELTLHMLARLLQSDGCHVEVIHADAAFDLAALVRERQPALVFLGVLPPGGMAEARFLCRRLSKVLPDLKVAVGCWCEDRFAERAVSGLRAAGAMRVATTLAVARQQIRVLATMAPAKALAASAQNQSRPGK